jgi:predicted amidohydrolase YtcJ
MSADTHSDTPTADAGADLLVLADRIHTLAPTAAPAATALLVHAGRIAAIGTAAQLRDEAPHARVLDLAGATLTPGLTDAHVHLTEWAFARREVDLSTAASPEAAARSVVAHAHASHPYAAAAGSAAAAWLRGRGWNAHLWQGRHPDRHVLDAVVGDRPVALQSHDMHALWVNSAALRAAGIDAATADPEGGQIVRDGAGEPTGLLLEWAAQLVTRALPVPTLDQAANAVADAQAELHALGITGVHSFPGVHFPEPDPLAVLLALHERGRLHLRVLQHIPLDLLDHAVRLGLRSGFGDEWLRIGAVKMFLDGALGSRTAWMREPYEGEAGSGMNTLEPRDFRAAVQRAAAAGIATTVHAIGDAAVSLALDVLADPALRVAGLPHRIEHVQCCPPERFTDAARAGVVCSMQPSHLITDWSIAERCWGARSRGAFALASLLRAGTTLAFGSDVPVEPVDPRRGLFAAVARQDYEGRPAQGWQPQERIGLEDALRGYTTGPAAAAGLAPPAGTLTPGAAADLVAWDADPLAGAESARSMRCVATVVGGRIVHTGC